MSEITTSTIQTERRTAITRIPTYEPGKPIEEVARELGIDPASIVKLASNENPLGPSPLALEAMQRHLRDVLLYPDSDSYELRHALATHLDVEADEVIVGRGSDEVMRFLALAYLEPGDEVVMGDPTFSMYAISAVTMGAVPVKVPLNDYRHDLPAMLAAITPRTKLVYITNPHNPTGAVTPRDEVEAFLDQVPQHVLVVLDDAYHQYAVDSAYPDSLAYAKAGRNVIVLHTFSKIYALAGLRLGYGISCRREVMAALNQVREPFNVANLAQWAAIASLQDTEQVARGRALNEAGKQQLYAAFDRLGLPYVPTNTNFILVETHRPARAVFDALLRTGIIVRSAVSFGYPTKIRVTTGLEAENARFVAALEEVLGEIARL